MNYHVAPCGENDSDDAGLHAAQRRLDQTVLQQVFQGRCDKENDNKGGQDNGMAPGRPAWLLPT